MMYSILQNKSIKSHYTVIALVLLSVQSVITASLLWCSIDSKLHVITVKTTVELL